MDTRPKLISGPSAYRWRRIFVWSWVVALGLLAIAGILWVVLSVLRLPTEPAFFALLPGGVLVIVLRMFGEASPRETAETELGYTTLPEVYPNLDHLHPTTGEVLRPAGMTPLTAREFRTLLKRRRLGPSAQANSSSGTSGVLMPPLEAMTDRKGRPIPAVSTPKPVSVAVPTSDTQPVGGVFPARSRFGSIVPLALIVGGFIVAGAFGLKGRGGVPLLGIGVAALVLVGVLILSIWLSARGRRARVAVYRPTAVLYDGLLTADLRHASHRLGQGPMVGHRTTVAISETGLEFWTQRRVNPDLVVRWTDVLAAEPGVVAYANGLQPAVVVEVETNIGRTTVPVAITSAYYLAAPSGHRLNELLFAIRDRIPRR